MRASCLNSVEYAQSPPSYVKSIKGIPALTWCQSNSWSICPYLPLINWILKTTSYFTYTLNIWALFYSSCIVYKPKVSKPNMLVGQYNPYFNTRLHLCSIWKGTVLTNVHICGHVPFSCPEHCKSLSLTALPLNDRVEFPKLILI